MTPTVLIVPGSFTPAVFYNNLANQIRDQSIGCEVYDLPSTNRKPPQQAATFEEDVALIHGKASEIIRRGHDVLLLAHSYGGSVATQAVKGLLKTDSQTNGLANGVLRIVYMSCPIPVAGHGIFENMGTLPEFMKIEGNFLYQEPEVSGPLMWPDLPESEALVFAKQLTWQSRLSFDGKLTYSGYKYLPVSYILCGNDPVLSPAFQQQMIALLERENQQTVDVHTCKGTHCPNQGIPGTIAQIIRSISDVHI
ncbi:unnamed protein product [Penicillium olsonii]|uniref:AB hydrolase-1 domain-containing protein n=1 Tax=Penicillium olsonii TaxID=99116 RepID=A0A9W4HT54_PENOL|nr:unnamed protein product [Penicillium olsonii]CAG8207438.1 unnamed protein product [Penicillium olsonii]